MRVSKNKVIFMFLQGEYNNEDSATEWAGLHTW